MEQQKYTSPDEIYLAFNAKGLQPLSFADLYALEKFCENWLDILPEKPENLRQQQRLMYLEVILEQISFEKTRRMDGFFETEIKWARKETPVIEEDLDL